MATLSAHPTSYLNYDEPDYDLYAFTRLENIDRALDDANTTNYSIMHMAKSSSVSMLSKIEMLSFDFSALPSNAIINGITIAIKTRVYSTTTCTETAFELFSGNYTFHGEYTQIPINTQYQIYTYSSNDSNLGSWTADEVKSIGVNLYARHNASNTNCYFYLWGITITVDYSLPTIPVITVLSQDKNKISSISGSDQCTATFQSDIALQAWEARATLPEASTGHGVGILVESGGSLAANTPTTVYVDDEELTNGDNDYTITIYGQSSEGMWSNG